MIKILTVVDGNDGRLLEQREIIGGYNVTYQANAEGLLGKIRTLESGRLPDGKMVISNHLYMSIAKALRQKFQDMLGHVNLDLILFLEDTAWKPPNSDKKQWKAKISLANKYLEALVGYRYIIELRRYFIEEGKLERSKIVSLIYKQLRRIDKDGGLSDFEVQEHPELIATLGENWEDTQSSIMDILSDEFVCWDELKPAGSQMSLFERRAV